MNERKLLRKLSIPDWRYLSKDKVMSLVAELKHLDPEIAKSVIQQIPVVVSGSVEMFNGYKEAISQLMNKCTDSQRLTLDTIARNIDSINDYIRDRNGELTPEAYAMLIDRQIAMQQQMFDINREQREFVLIGIRNFSIIALTALVAVVRILNQENES